MQDENIKDNMNQKLNYNQINKTERQPDIQRLHKQYIAQKMLRKQKMLHKRKLQFPSSSFSSDDSNNEDIMDNISSGSSMQKQKKWHAKQNNNEMQGRQSTQVSYQSIEKIPINTIKKGGELIKDVLIFDNNMLYILNIAYDIKKITKLKIIEEFTQGYPYRIKINIDNNQVLFSPAFGISQQINRLYINYYTFSRILQQHLLLKTYKLQKPITQKIPAVPQGLIHNALIYGKIIKKSQVLGKWQQRFVVINREGLFSYRKFNEKYSMNILNGSIKQIWTRFQIYDQMLVVKLMHNKRKIELGLPLTQLLSSSCWLYHIFCIMNKK